MTTASLAANRVSCGKVGEVMKRKTKKMQKKIGFWKNLCYN